MLNRQTLEFSHKLYAAPDSALLQQLSQEPVTIRLIAPKQIVKDFNRGVSIDNLAKDAFSTGTYKKMSQARDYVNQCIYAEIMKGKS